MVLRALHFAALGLPPSNDLHATRIACRCHGMKPPMQLFLTPHLYRKYCGLGLLIPSTSGSQTALPPTTQRLSEHSPQNPSTPRGSKEWVAETLPSWHTESVLGKSGRVRIQCLPGSDSGRALGPWLGSQRVVWSGVLGFFLRSFSGPLGKIVGSFFGSFSGPFLKKKT